jgi:ABC transporter DrrB family efflux protein
MSVMASGLEQLVAARAEGGFVRGLKDVLSIARRNLLVDLRNPETIVFGVIQPITLLALFVVVFGGVVNIPGVPYVQYIVPAVLVQTAAFAGISTAVVLNADLQKGIIDRFRSLPMARSAVLGGRTLADTVRITIQMLIVLGVSFLFGFRIEGGLFGAAGAVAVAVLFGFAMTWIFATIGLSVRSEQAVSAASFSWLFPLVFLSSAYVPLDTLPGWLQPIARVNPITFATDGVRALALGGSVAGPLAGTLAWVAGIVVVFSTLAVRIYRRAA